MMQVISTNVSTWIRTIVWESEAELNSYDEKDIDGINITTEPTVTALPKG